MLEKSCSSINNNIVLGRYAAAHSFLSKYVSVNSEIYELNVESLKILTFDVIIVNHNIRQPQRTKENVFVFD